MKQGLDDQRLLDRKMERKLVVQADSRTFGNRVSVDQGQTVGWIV